MRFFLSTLLFLISTFTHGYTKVYDCFIFYNELELLTIRLEELWDSVDYFVLVESIETHRGGNLKPLNFQENKDKFEKYLSKIIYVPIEERHPEFDLWEREWYQRNCISRGLINCKPNDIIIISDIDEIPRSAQLPSYIRTLAHYAKRAKDRISAVSLQQSIYFFQLNRQTPTKETWGGGWWIGTVLTTYEQFTKATAQYFRDNRGKFPIINDAGWHFTWMGGAKAVKEKISVSSEGPGYPVNIADADIEKWLNNHPIVPLDSSFPAYILNNIEHFKSIEFLGE